VESDRVGPRVAAEEARLATVGAQQPEEDPDAGRLPGPVRPEKPVDLAALDREVEAVESARRAEGLDEAGDLDRGRHAGDRTLISQNREMSELRI